MSSYFWVKINCFSLSDPHLAKLPDRIWRRYFELNILVRDLYGMDADGSLPGLADIAFALRITDEGQLAEDLKDLVNRGLLADCAGTWKLTRFAQEQAAIPDVDRKVQERLRKRKNANGHGTVTERPERVTNRDREVEVDLDLELDLEREEEKEVVAARGEVNKDATKTFTKPSSKEDPEFIVNSRVLRNVGVKGQKNIERLASLRHVNPEYLTDFIIPKWISKIPNGEDKSKHVGLLVTMIEDQDMAKEW